MLELEPVYQQLIVFGTILFALIFWLWGRWRYDFVALFALLVISITGIIPFEDTFSGFSSSAVIIIIAVLVLSRGLLNSGVVDLIVSKLPLENKGRMFQISALTVLTTILSAFVYNIGALALLMPVAIRVARKSEISPALFLMPMAFGANLGGFFTLIGNAPNIIVSTFRTQAGMEPFGMFDFSYVGGWLVLAAVLFIGFVGWRLIPERKPKDSSDEGSFDVENYTAELNVTEKSKLAGKTLGELYKMTKESFLVVALIRNGEKSMAPQDTEMLQENDNLLIEAEPEVLQELIGNTKLEIDGNNKASEQQASSGDGEKEVKNSEVVVVPESITTGKHVRDLHLSNWYGVNLLAVSRQGEQLSDELDDVLLQPGDVLLLRGASEHIQEVVKYLGLLPLAKREVPLGQPRRIFTAVSILFSAITVAALGIMPVEVIFMAAALVMVLSGLAPLRQAYESIEWPIIVLVGAMIPFGAALEASGAVDNITSALLGLTSFNYITPVALLAIVFVVSMILSNLINNVGVAVLMSPIAILLAQGINASVDPFLMAVAIGASCAFMTPVGHQANMLVFRPGGYKFGDFWKVGLALNVIILVLALPLILRVWPL